MVFVGSPDPDEAAAEIARELAALADERRVAILLEAPKYYEAVRDGISIARLVDAGDVDSAVAIADVYALTLEELAPQLQEITMYPGIAPGAADPSAMQAVVELVAVGYRLASHANAGHHDQAAQLAGLHGVTLHDIYRALDGAS